MASTSNDICTTSSGVQMECISLRSRTAAKVVDVCISVHSWLPAATKATGTSCYGNTSADL